MEDPVARIGPSCNVVGGVWEILRQGRVTWEVVPDEMSGGPSGPTGEEPHREPGENAGTSGSTVRNSS
ncbi:hypothetical protein QR685DRAFT_536027 [Neurospora intermedia]|uniref:Uncharacterized protein n=1 Tax=Neurospora intermedia TaxID=5142 RepID=A0ABR3D0L4_NEUIN